MLFARFSKNIFARFFLKSAFCALFPKKRFPKKRFCALFPKKRFSKKRFSKKRFLRAFS
jgi:hypothetical protein